MIVAFTSWRFRGALEAQNDSLFKEVYAWKMPAYPIPPGWLMTMCFLLLISCFALGIKPPVSANQLCHILVIEANVICQGTTVNQFSASTFFQYTLGIWIITGLTLGYKLLFRTPWRNLEEADLKSGRRVLSENDYRQLHDYYAKPAWRRFLTYLKLW